VPYPGWVALEQDSGSHFVEASCHLCPGLIDNTGLSLASRFPGLGLRRKRLPASPPGGYLSSVLFPPTSQLFLAAHPTSGSRCLLCSCVLYQVASESSRESGSGLSNSPLSGSLNLCSPSASLQSLPGLGWMGTRPTELSGASPSLWLLKSISFQGG